MRFLHFLSSHERIQATAYRLRRYDSGAGQQGRIQRRTEFSEKIQSDGGRYTGTIPPVPPAKSAVANSRDLSESRSRLFQQFPRAASFAAWNNSPSEPFVRIQCSSPALLQIIDICLADILFPSVFLISGVHQCMRDFNRHVEKSSEIRPR